MVNVFYLFYLNTFFKPILIQGIVLDNLIYHYQDITQNRSRTFDNYALRKFHLNTFMNIVRKENKNAKDFLF